jgi:hypothetical protein
MIVLEASAFDPDEAFLGGANVRGRSSRDGLLGLGAMLLRESTRLSEGAHVISATATDSGGLTARDPIAGFGASVLWPRAPLVDPLPSWNLPRPLREQELVSSSAACLRTETVIACRALLLG